MSDETNAACPYCGGQGWVEVEKVRPVCCGRLSPSGSCRADCAIPEQYQEQCGACGGSGVIIVTVAHPTTKTGE